VKALTERQPHAELIRRGVQTIVTRPKPTDHRGPVAIHAAKRPPRHSEIEPMEERLDRLGLAIVDLGREWAVAHRDGDEWSSASTSYDHLPLGAVVATATLTDCVPIVSWAPLDGPPTWAAHMIPIADAEPGTRRMILVRDAAGAAEHDAAMGPLPAEIDASDQLPFGDFTQGRWAWLLDDVKPVDPPVPARGRQGLWNWHPDCGGT